MWWPALLLMGSPELAHAGRVVQVGPELRTLALPLPLPVLDALRTEDWDGALAALAEVPQEPLTKAQRDDLAFVTVWAHVQNDTSGEASENLDELQPFDGVAPQVYVNVARGAVLHATGESASALELFDSVPKESPLFPFASSKASDALRALGREDAAWKRIEGLVDRPDPAPEAAPLLMSLVEHYGPASEEARPLLRRLWAYYPSTDAAEQAESLLRGAEDPYSDWALTALRAERQMAAEQYDRALSTADQAAQHVSDASEGGCRLRYTIGRSNYKLNRLRDAAEAFEGIGAQCADVDGNYGPRGLYLLGTAQYRRKQFDASARAYERLARTYPSSSMADDAWTRGGISLLEGDQAALARTWWARALDDHPDGDTVPEAALRLAFAHYDDGETARAIEIAEQLAALPVEGNAVHVEAGRYWAARWRIYPDANAPRTPTTDGAARAEAVERWAALCRDLPHSFYAILAFSRLQELEPSLARVLDQRNDALIHAAGTPWEIRKSLLRNGHYRDGVALVRLGLVQEGLTEWMKSDPASWTSDEKAWSIELRIAAGDWLAAHDNFRRWIIANPLTTLGKREPQIISLAWPQRYWKEVRNSVREGYVFEPRLFHALVREESNFNRRIVSFAGARGLSQLMWRTAQQTAGWLEVSVTKEQLFQPQPNLNIGARYLDAMHRQLSGSPYLALAAYNGGARNVSKWVDEHDNPPVDEWVERVPFRETRGYIKRVMGTWQTMRYHFDEGSAFPDLSAYNHRARP